MDSSSMTAAYSPPRRTKTVHFTPENASTSNNELTHDSQDQRPNHETPPPNYLPNPTAQRPKHAPRRYRNRPINRIPTMVQNWYTHREFRIWYIRRVELEQHLLNATIALPNHAGLTEGRIAELKRALKRDTRALPRTDREWERDDLPRVHAVIALIKARHSIRAETDATMEKWNNIAIYKEWDRESDERKKDIVLVELEKRKDGEWLVRWDNHCKYRDAMSRFLNATTELPNKGGLTKSQITLLRPVFSGNDDRANAIEAWWQRRNALICILRARRRVRIRQQPEINGTWEGYELPNPESPNLRELCGEEIEEGMELVGEHLGLVSAPSPEELRMIRPIAELHEHELSPMPENIMRGPLQI